jgi:hypothetical protein
LKFFFKNLAKSEIFFQKLIWPLKYCNIVVVGLQVGNFGWGIQIWSRIGASSITRGDIGIASFNMIFSCCWGVKIIWFGWNGGQNCAIFSWNLVSSAEN